MGHYASEMGLPSPHAEFHQRRDRLLQQLANRSIAEFPAILAGDLARVTDTELATEAKYRTSLSMDRIEAYLKEHP